LLLLSFIPGNRLCVGWTFLSLDIPLLFGCRSRMSTGISERASCLVSIFSSTLASDTFFLSFLSHGENYIASLSLPERKQPSFLSPFLSVSSIRVSFLFSNPAPCCHERWNAIFRPTHNKNLYHNCPGRLLGGDLRHTCEKRHTQAETNFYTELTGRGDEIGWSRVVRGCVDHLWWKFG
jgi:hypothetical protein